MGNSRLVRTTEGIPALGTLLDTSTHAPRTSSRSPGPYSNTYTEALAIHKSIGDDLGRANALNGLGDVRREQSKYVEAEPSYTEALAIFNSIGDDLGRVNTYLGLADIWIHQERYVEAKALVADAASKSERIDYAWGINTSEKLLDTILKIERLPNTPSASTPPTPTNSEDSSSLASYLETDEPSATSA